MAVRPGSLLRRLRWSTGLAACALALPSGAVGETSHDYALFQKYQTSAGAIEGAVALFRSRAYPRAEQGFKAVLKQVPDHHQARFYLAQLTYLRGDYAGSLQQIEAALAGLEQLRILHASALADHQRQALERVQMIETIRTLQEAKNPKPNYPGNTLLLPLPEAPPPPSAEPPFRIPAAYHLVRGNALFRLGRLAEAEAPYRLATEAEPHSAEAWNNLVNLLLLERKLPAALQALDQAEALGVRVGDRLRQALDRARDGSGCPG